MSFTKKRINCPEAGESCLLATHSSGLRVYISNKDTFVTNYAVFGTKYGSVDTEFGFDGQPMLKTPEGIAHFLEHKLFEGEDGDAFEKYSKTGASANAYTSFDRTCYLFSCSDRFYENLDILLSFVSSPYFTEQTVQKEQGIIGQEIKMYEDVPDWRVLFNLFRIMYHNHPVKIEIAGTVESIAEISAKTLYDCYNTFYDPSNMYLCLAGNFDTDKVLEMVDAKIKPADERNIVRSDFSEPETIVESRCELKMAVSMPLFVMGIKDKPADSEHLPIKKATAELFLEILAGKISPLYNSLLEQGLINNRFGTEHFYGNSYAAILFDGESKDPDAVKEAIVSEIKKIAENGADPSLFDDAKRKLYGHSIRGYNDAEEAVGEFIDCYIDGTEPYADLLALKKITVDDVTAFARSLKPQNVALSVISPQM
ncbi:MAG: insulinase family protein [Ruminococcaceae bacterium]|nr:insulinase family protein [Oscillospiraceae bacterium]